MNCDKHIEEIINTYIKFGWADLTKIFMKEKIAKEKKTYSGVSEKLLKMLGGIREFYVDHLFNCINDDPNTNYVSFGSTNVTSDYDITILGKNAPTVMWKIFDDFLIKYKNTLAESFDTNLYCSGYYNSVGINENVCFKIDDKISILKLGSLSDIKINLEFALMKLSDIDLYLYTKSEASKKLVQFSQKRKINLDKLYDLQFEKTKKRYTDITNNETLKLITKYKLNAHISKKLYDNLYGTTTDIEKTHIFACASSYYSIEAYYTCCGVNVVVMELQAKKKDLNLHPIEYVCCALENLGDLRHHIVTYEHPTEVTQLLIKLSKYIYRIYYSLSKLDTKYTETSNNILEKIIKQRDSIVSFSEEQYLLLGYDKSYDLLTYAKTFTNNILPIVFNYVDTKFTP